MGKAAAWFWCVALLALCKPAAATTNDLFGHGTRSQALAGTGAAYAAPEEAAYGNPARFSAARQRRLTLGYQVARFGLSGTTPTQVHDLSDTAHGFTLQLSLPLPFGGVLKDRVGLGVGSYLPSQLIAHAGLPFPETPQFPLLASRAQALGFAAGLGIEVGWGWRVGVGLSSLAEVFGELSVGKAGSGTGSEILATFSPIIGLSYDVDEDLSFGVVWRDEVRNEFDVDLTLEDLVLIRVPRLQIAGVAHYDPMQVSAGVRQDLGFADLTAEATVKLWSRFSGWQRATIVCPPQRPQCDALQPDPVRFETTVVPRIALAFPWEPTPALAAELRIGYFFEPTPLEEQTGASNYWDGDRHVLTLGYGLELPHALLPLRASLAWQFHQLVDRSHQKLDASPNDPGAPRVHTSGSVNLISFALGVAF